MSSSRTTCTKKANVDLCLISEVLRNINKSRLSITLVIYVIFLLAIGRLKPKCCWTLYTGIRSLVLKAWIDRMQRLTP